MSMAMVFWLLKHFREFINFHKKQQQQTHLKPNKNSNKINTVPIHFCALPVSKSLPRHFFWDTYI